MKKTTENLLRRIIREEIGRIAESPDTDSIFKELSDRFSTANYKVRQQSVGILASYYNNSVNLSISVNYESDHPAGPFYLAAISDVIVKSTSLADPRSSYQTTSARRVAKKKINDRLYLRSIDDIVNAINKHIGKVNKISNGKLQTI